MDMNAEALPSRSGIPPIESAESPDFDRLARDSRAFIADCEALLRNAHTLSGEGADVLRSELTRRMTTARLRLDEIRTVTGQHAVRARGATEDYVRREPLKALCIAGAAGMLMGMIMTRR